MQELNSLIQARLEASLADGTLDGIIEKHVTGLLDSVVSSSLRSHGDVGKVIQEKLNQSLMSGVSKVSMPEYHHVINQVVVGHVQTFLNEEALKSLNDALNEVMRPVPTQMTGREFIDQLREILAGETDEDGSTDWEDRDTRITLTFKNGAGDFKIIFYDHYHKGEWYIGYLEDDMGRALTRGLSGFTHAIGTPDAWLFKLYCTGTIFSDLDDVIGEDVHPDREY